MSYEKTDADQMVRITVTLRRNGAMTLQSERMEEVNAGIFGTIALGLLARASARFERPLHWGPTADENKEPS